MLHAFRKLLEKADGRSEFAIVVVCDIRGFSEFSTVHESPDTAMFIKRFYLKLIDDYFPTAQFVKPTGDGLLIIYRYTEDNLNDISKDILGACLNCINDFQKLFKEDPMINFETPKNIGFGISRGPVCCLFSGKQIIDYSGRLLNLASRLMDLARPKGIVIDGNYLIDVVPEDLRGRFKDYNAYIRSIAEETPHLIYYLSPEVELPDYCLHPIKKYDWKEEVKDILAGDLLKLSGNYGFHLKKKALYTSKIKTGLKYPHPNVKGYTRTSYLNDFKYKEDASGPHILIDVKGAIKIIEENKVKPHTKVQFVIDYIAK